MYKNENEIKNNRENYFIKDSKKYDTLKMRILNLPCEQYEEHQKLISRFANVCRVEYFLHDIRGHELTKEELDALDNLEQVFFHRGPDGFDIMDILGMH